VPAEDTTLLERGRALNAARRAAAQDFAAAVMKALDELGMPGARFDVRIDDGDGELDARATAHGLGTLTFLVSPNAGEDLRELGRIASGGELARVALAVRGELAEADSVPVLVFDEIDADVGPRLGETIGRKLLQLARHRQVIVVTHLPQVAAFADTHVRVRKETLGERTVAHAETVTGAEREHEIAEMLRGAERAAAALDQARDLLAEAGEDRA
jgi:DNA repair protein RecN (Recombination protein N)